MIELRTEFTNKLFSVFSPEGPKSQNFAWNTLKKIKLFGEKSEGQTYFYARKVEGQKAPNKTSFISLARSPLFACDQNPDIILHNLS